MRTPLVTAALAAGLLTTGLAAQDSQLQTVPERTDYQSTSTTSEVEAFLDGLAALPHSDRIQRIELGQSKEGRTIHGLLTGSPPPGRLQDPRPENTLRALILANIHGGEVEGKEAVQMLLREIALGGHGRLVESAQILWVPIYNVDGNDNIDVKNRVDQNGPVGGVGTRPDANGLDLNRDFLKAESENTRALLLAMQRFDPHVFMDLHTTDGSWHGYHLTYSPSLSANVDPTLDGFTRGTLLPEARGRMQRQGWRTFDYGNFDRRPGGRSRDQTPTRWSTYDHRPRFGTNYFGLRNRIAVLSEAYSHLDFRGRVDVTRQFVLQVLNTALDHSAEIQALCSAADRRCLDAQTPIYFGTDTTFAAPTVLEILRGDCKAVELPGVGTRVEMLPDVAEPLELKVYDRFVAQRQQRIPQAWLLPLEAGNVIGPRLARHGVFFQVLKRPLEVQNAQRFVISQGRRARSAYQGHRTLQLQGEWEPVGKTINLTNGAIMIQGRQALARLVAQLLDPESEDSLATWGAMDPLLGDGEIVPGTAYPVLRVR